MPRFRVTTDDGRQLTVTLGSVPKDPEALDRALATEISAGRGVPDKSLAQRAVSAVAGPVTAGLSRLIQGGINAGSAQALPGMALAGNVPAEMISPPTTTPMSQGIAGAVVPQTPVQAGAQGALLAAAPFTGGMSLLGGAALRTGAAAIGAGLGAAADSQSPLGVAQEAGVTGLTTAAMEAAGWGIGKLARSIHGARNLINKNEWDDLATEVSKYVPGLFKAKNQSDLKKRIMTGDALKVASDRYVAALDRVDGLIGKNLVDVPSLSYTPITLKDAVERLKTLGHDGFSGSRAIPIKRTIAGRPERATWEEGREEILANLDRFNPTKEARALFEQHRKEYAVTQFWHDVLEKPDTWHGGPNIVEINFNRVRDYVEANASRLKNLVGPDDFEEIVAKLQRGGPFGGRDVMPAGFGSTADASGQLLRSGGGTGTVGVLGPRTLLPNVGAQYTGQAPRSMGAAPQTLLDLIGQGVTQGLPLR